uniref:Uncharacterized protein n=1 Tax=Ditylenchus dipsaci TaxID=166011 RepID=A0A915E5M1_9BILA
MAGGGGTPSPTSRARPASCWRLSRRRQEGVLLSLLPQNYNQQQQQNKKGPEGKPVNEQQTRPLSTLAHAFNSRLAKGLGFVFTKA